MFKFPKFLLTAISAVTISVANIDPTSAQSLDDIDAAWSYVQLLDSVDAYVAFINSYGDIDSPLLDLARNRLVALAAQSIVPTSNDIFLVADTIAGGFVIVYG